MRAVANNAMPFQPNSAALGWRGQHSSAVGNRKSTMQAGRFGWKSQHSSLLSACAESLRNELGIRNRLYSDEYPTHNTSGGTAPPTPFDKPDPADAGPGK